MNATATAEDTQAAAREIVAKLARQGEECAREIAATGYSQTVEFVGRGFGTVTLHVGPNSTRQYWEVTAVGFTHMSLGRTAVGDVKSRFFFSLAEAREFANGWAKSLLAKGYRMRPGRAAA